MLTFILNSFLYYCNPCPQPRDATSRHERITLQVLNHNLLQKMDIQVVEWEKRRKIQKEESYCLRKILDEAFEQIHSFSTRKKIFQSIRKANCKEIKVITNDKLQLLHFSQEITILQNQTKIGLINSKKKSRNRKKFRLFWNNCCQLQLITEEQKKRSHFIQEQIMAVNQIIKSWENQMGNCSNQAILELLFPKKNQTYLSEKAKNFGSSLTICTESNPY